MTILNGTRTASVPCEWIDLVDPSGIELMEALPFELHRTALDRLTSHHRVHDDDPRPRLRAEGTYVFGVFVVPVLVEDENRTFLQEVNLVVTHDRVVTCRKTPTDGPAFSSERLDRAIAECRECSAGMVTFHVVDEIAEAFLEFADSLHGEIDELEDGVERWTDDAVRARVSDLRHDLLKVRRVLGPTREAIQRIVADRIELPGEELFPQEVELYFEEVADKLSRAAEALDFSRDILASVRDYHQAKVANNQNEVMQRLTVVASLLLVPTFIVGVYGQNFEHMPELHWFQGYAMSWFLIVTTTVAQLLYFRRKRWI